MSDADLGEELVRLASADNFRDVTGPVAAYVATRRDPAAARGRLPLQRAPAHPADAASLARLGIIRDLRPALGPRGRDPPRRRRARRDVDHSSRSRASRWRPSPTSHDRATAHDVMQQVYRGFVRSRGARARSRGCSARSPTAAAPVRSSTARPARTAPAGRRHCCCTSPASTTRRSSRTTCSPTPSPRPPGRSTSAWSASTSARTRSTVYERVMVSTRPTCRPATTRSPTAYGDREGYLRDGLGLDEDTLARLRGRMRA